MKDGKRKGEGGMNINEGMMNLAIMFFLNVIMLRSNVVYYILCVYSLRTIIIKYVNPP